MNNTNKKEYVVASIKSWNRRAYDLWRPCLPGRWHFFSGKSELTIDKLLAIAPRYVFLPHWSWLVPAEITDRFECVCFHMADVPYGRGGSPLQNLIMRGHAETKLSALRMTQELDAGPVYMKESLSLEGSAQQIYERAAELSFQMIREIVEHEPDPIQQSGEVTLFSRRTPSESRLPAEASARQLYDFIRMLDAEGYPHAFLEWDGGRLQFTDANLENGSLTAKVTFVGGDKKNG